MRQLMNLKQVYQWSDEIARHFLKLSKPQVFNLAAASLGVIAARDCRLALVAEELSVLGKAESVERRLRRLLDNDHLEREACQKAWIRWVLRHFQAEAIVLVVDETKLGVHLATMMVGLAYRQRCIPLAWRCYPAQGTGPYPPEGQVALIVDLLRQVDEVLMGQMAVCVQADQGIGTSPDLMRAVQALGWHYLFRIQGSCHVLLDGWQDCEVRSLVEKGGYWAGRGQVFKGDGWSLTMDLRLIWEAGYDQAWYLATNQPLLEGHEYGQRNWAEQSFRDLKSGGWKWDDSQVWQADHAERLILILALAYACILNYGSLEADTTQAVRANRKRVHPRLSIFRMGMRTVKEVLHHGFDLLCHFHFLLKPDCIPAQAFW
jgi:hypothetical protein